MLPRAASMDTKIETFLLDSVVHGHHKYMEQYDMSTKLSVLLGYIDYIVCDPQILSCTLCIFRILNTSFCKGENACVHANIATTIKLCKWLHLTCSYSYGILLNF